ncbi:hypothetical protein, partial [Actinomyces sp. Z3]|uniref:hypothetical protein n=1 Tax=Actinomyces sp. Z3 TaxID=2250217 RepID=UPI001C65BB00
MGWLDAWGFHKQQCSAGKQHELGSSFNQLVCFLRPLYGSQATHPGRVLICEQGVWCVRERPPGLVVSGWVWVG